MPPNENYEELDAKLLKQMRQDFIEESLDLLDQLNLNLTQLEKTPTDADLINTIFRNAHTLKGSAAFVDLVQINAVGHKMEDIFGLIRRKSLVVTAAVIDVMFKGLEVLATLRNQAITGADEPMDIAVILDKLECVKGQVDPEITADAEPGSNAQNQVQSAPAATSNENQTAPGGETSNTAVGSKSALSETIRVPTKRLDSLMNLAGELITGRNRLNEFAGRFKNDELESIASAVARLTGQLHAEIMGVRMVPVERLFIKFPGVVRNLARESGKEVNFIIDGKQTELDKTVIEQIYDPLVHLLRNAVDHGIEAPEERVRLGKPPKGQIRLSSRHYENNVIIVVADDGRGIDPERLKQKAIQKGICSEKEAAAMSDEQAIRLIFAPGFSTAAKVTDVSGRGVGMDVVKEHVQRLRGMVDVSTNLGAGTTFRIQMPLTLAILEVLLVSVGNLVYALPIYSVSETLLLSSSEIRTMEKNEVVFIRGVAYPFKRLQVELDIASRPPDAGLLSLPSMACEPKDASSHTTQTAESGDTDKYLHVVVVGLADKRVALCVDELIGKQEVVIKSLGEYLGRVEGVDGASVLADGSVTLIVDVEAVSA